MIKLDATYVTSVSTTLAGATVTTTTDELFVQSVSIDFLTGQMLAIVQRGTGTPFSANMAPLRITVNPDGTFASLDGSWSGSVSAAPALVAQLKATFDQFILASGKVTGSTI